MGTHRRGRAPREPEQPDETGAEAPSQTSLPSPLVDLAPTSSIRAIFRRFWPDTRGFRRRMALSLLLVAVPPGLAAAGIWLFKILVDDVLTARNVALFPMVAAAFVAITMLEGVVGFFDEYLNAWVAERFVLNLRGRIFGHLQRLSLTFFEKRQTGDLLARLTGDVAAIEQLMLSGLNQALTYVFQIIFFGGALFILNWRLALAALAGAPILLLLGRFFARRIKAASRERRRRSGSISAVAEESLNNTALVQSYDRAGMESARFHRENLGSFTAQMLATKLEALFSPFTDLLEAAGALLVIALGLRELIAGRITLGGLLVFIGYLTQLYGPITGFGDLANTIFAASAGAERIIEVLDAKPDVLDPADPVPLGRARGAVRVHRLGFRYPDSGRPALAEVSFSVEPGETVAVVGASGAGKSTLLHLLLRLYDPGNGAVTLDGVDLRRLRLSTLRRNLAVVLQQTLVFDGTVAENIRWGKPDATPAEVVAAARAADAHQFITGLPGGYHARIGQRGMMLSGGQLQRIALARAMIRNAPVLLLDEPTTGLDAVSTQRVLDPLRRAMNGRTTIVISHNLLTVTDADRIVYLDRGRVRGYGTHQELMASCPGYARLYRLHHPDAAAPLRPTPHPRRAPAVRPTPHPRPKPGPGPGPGPGPARTPAPVPALRAPAPRPRTARPTPIAISGPHPLPAPARPITPGPLPIPETIRLAITEPPMPKHARTTSSGPHPLPKPSQGAGSGAHSLPEPTRDNTSGPHPLPKPTRDNTSGPHPLPKPTRDNTSGPHPLPKPTRDNTSGPHPLPKPTRDNTSGPHPLPNAVRVGSSGPRPRSEARTGGPGPRQAPRPEPGPAAGRPRPTPNLKPRTEPATAAIPARPSPGNGAVPVPASPFEPETRPVPAQLPTGEARPSPYPRPRQPSEPMPPNHEPDWLFSAEPRA